MTSGFQYFIIFTVIAAAIILIGKFILRSKQPENEEDLLPQIEAVKKIAAPLAKRAMPLVEAAFTLGRQCGRLSHAPFPGAPQPPISAYMDSEIPYEVTIRFRTPLSTGDIYYRISKHSASNGVDYHIHKSIYNKSITLGYLSWNQTSDGTINPTSFNGRDRNQILDPLLPIPAIIEPYKKALDQYFAHREQQDKIHRMKSTWGL